MTALFRNSFGLGFLGICLSFSIPVLAQSQNNTAPAPQMNGGSGSIGVDAGGYERQDIREEREQIRKEHEDLEAAHDRLREQCANAQGTQAQSCEEQRAALRDRHEQLHERVEALHAKIQQVREARGEPVGNAPMPMPNNSMPTSGSH
jgi:hypothetical protein